MAITLTAPLTETAPRRGDALGRVLTVVLLSVYGGWLSTIALMVIAYRLTGSVAAPGALVVVRILARLVGAVPGGVLADRHGAGRAVALCAACQAAVCVTVVAALNAHIGGLWLLYLATFVAQAAAGMAQSATGGLVVQSVAPERRGYANGLVGTVVSASVL
ncbi:MAG TPA: MFS transporter, partial [Candidatus Dormibacteraeota bacterium]|nr:MFS transporter [Candidatus Dormibacteraeota bacterium]